MRVIIADDVFYARKAVEKMVREWDAQVDILELCDNGARVVKLLGCGQVDVLILDIRMPGVDGIQLAELVRAEYPAIKIILVSGYAEFEYAQAAIRSGVFCYLLKPLKKEELFSALNDIKRAAIGERMHLQKLSETQYVTESFCMMRYLEGMENAEARYPLPQSTLQKGCIPAVLHCKGISYSKLMALVEDMLPEETFLYGDLLHEESRVLLLCNYAGLSETRFVQEAREQLEKLVAEVSRVEGLVLLAGLGRQCCEPEDMPRSYREAQRALCMRIVEPRRRVFVYKPPRDGEKRLFSPDELRLVRSKLHAHREEEGFALVKQRMGQLPSIRLEHLEQAYHELLSLCMTISLEKASEPEARQLPRQLWDFENAEQIIEYLSTLAYKKPDEKNVEGSIIEEIKVFLQENYYCDLSLNELAATKYYMNPNYLSRLFKAETGIGFSKYLLKLRMEKADELLRGAPMSINEIASMVGYASTSYFIANFKKYFGETPGNLSETIRES